MRALWQSAVPWGGVSEVRNVFLTTAHRIVPAAILVAALALCLAGCPRGPELPPPRLLISTAPDSGAEVTVNDIAAGPTPAVVEGLPDGNTLVVVEKEGYKRATKIVRFPKAGEERIIIELEPLVGYITIESKPTGAKVFLDGREYLGDTPLIHRRVVVGPHTYRLELDNHEPVESAVEVQQDYQYTFGHQLTARAAELIILSRPSGARIWINDEIRNETTPARFPLTPGAYSVRVHSKGYVMAEKSIQLGPNEEQTVELEMSEGDAPPGMVLVPAGKFTMGVNGASPDEQPQREVHLDAYYIDKNEVTNQEFQQVFPSHVFPKGRELLPVVGVSFNQASEYASKVGKRLATEAEWEKAARGADGREYPWGKEFQPDWCNFEGTGAADVVRVGTYRLGQSPYGCMDMAGNAYEWTADWYQPYPGNTVVTVDYGQRFRVLRGGSYLSDRFRVRCARRFFDRMDAAKPDYGFRCVKDVSAESGLAKRGS